MWVPIPGLDVWWYEVSNHGRIRSLDHWVQSDSLLGGAVEFLRRGRVLKTRFKPDGYPLFSVRPEGYRGKLLSFPVHRLVAKAFLPNPEGLPEVNHKDFNRRNNHVDNLEWVTRSENMRHAFTAGRGRKLNPEKARAVRERFDCGESLDDLATFYCVSRQTINLVLRGEIWNWGVCQ